MSSIYVTCKKCGLKYQQNTEEQVPGFREVDRDICPYCGHENGRSGDVEYFNKPLPEDKR